MELDVRGVPPTQGHALVFESFDALHAGECVTVVDDRDPKALLARFQADHQGAFEWWPLERGPERWRVQIGRRAPSAWTISDYLQTDHERLDRTLRLALETPGPAGYALFRQFRLGLERHIVIEESKLFPAFERATGMSNAGPTEVMRREHAVIKALLLKLDERFSRGRSAADVAAEFFEVISAHNAKEEHVLYPSCDEIVTGEARARFVTEMQAL